MVKMRRQLPEIGDYIVATISRVENHGAYAILNEYNDREGMIHISEVASSWVRNIRTYVRERQKIVAKVLSINERKGHIDLSLRRVTQQIKKAKVKQWKRSQKAENLLDMAVKKYNEINNTSKTLDDAYDEIGWKMEEIFGDILTGFEDTKQNGHTILTQKKLPAQWVSVIAEIAKNYVEIPHVKITGVIEIQCHKSDGILQIQKALKSGIDIVEGNGTKININLIGSPKYRIEVSSQGYKGAEAILEKVSKKIIDTISKSNGHAKFYREK